MEVASLELQGKGVNEIFIDHQQEEAIHGNYRVNHSDQREGFDHLNLDDVPNHYDMVNPINKWG
jgi:hypothetical protein